MFTVSRKHFEGNLTSQATKILADRENFPLKVPISFEFNDSSRGSEVSSYVIEQNFSVLPSPTRSGYVFNGWFYDEDFTTQALTTNKVRYFDKKLFAKWTESTKTYTELEYIENVGVTQYIDLNYIPMDDSKFEIKFNAPSRTGNWTVLFGSTTSDNSSDSVLLRFFDGFDDLNPWFGQVDYTDPTFTTTNGVDHTVILEQNTCTYDGDDYAIDSYPLDSPAKMFLFAGNYNGFWRPQRFKCYYFKVWEKDILTLDLIPVKDNSNVVCMYDKVSNTFYYNQGSGTFTAGPEKVTLYQYFKLRVDENISGTLIQMSELRFIDKDDNVFEYPDNVETSHTGSGWFSSNEGIGNLLDGSVYTKMCEQSFVAEDIIFNLKSQCLDIKTYSRWQWYTANDTADCPGRNLKTFSLYVSNDGTNWIQVDSQENYTDAPTANYTLAYTGNITLP